MVHLQKREESARRTALRFPAFNYYAVARSKKLLEVISPVLSRPQAERYNEPRMRRNLTMVGSITRLVPPLSGWPLAVYVFPHLA
jgi:hypothetical protein